MPIISLTVFVDFVLKVGTTKVTKVLEVKNQPAYDPKKDHWRLLRAHICDFHEGIVPNLTFIGTGANARKERLYTLAIQGYEKFLKKNNHQWFKPHRANWTYEDLTVNVNPEIGLTLDGKNYLIKLYLKEEKLTSARIQVALGLMREAIPEDYELAVLDVMRGQLHKAGGISPTLKALLEGEAATFLNIWKSAV